MSISTLKAIHWIGLNPINRIQLKRCLFLNATTGLFFPSCHLHLPQSPPAPRLTVKRLQRILRWQRRSFQLQTFVINSFALVIVVVLFFLVTISTSFNYNTNILSPLWFNACILLLLLSFFLSLFFAVELSSERASAISPGTLLFSLTFQLDEELTDSKSLRGSVPTF